MSNTEIPKQYEMFSGELVDNRTRSQKEQARRETQPQQTLMFSQRDIAQFGVNPKPLLPISEETKLALTSEDTRTEEEIGADTQRAAEKQTYQLFPQEDLLTPEELDENERIIFQAAQVAGLPFSVL
jgi:hypothetical protein